MNPGLNIRSVGGGLELSKVKKKKKGNVLLPNELLYIQRLLDIVIFRWVNAIIKLVSKIDNSAKQAKKHIQVICKV